MEETVAGSKLAQKLIEAWATVSRCQNHTLDYYTAAVAAWSLEAAVAKDERTKAACRRAVEINRAAAQPLLGPQLAKR